MNDDKYEINTNHHEHYEPHERETECIGREEAHAETPTEPKVENAETQRMALGLGAATEPGAVAVA